MARKLICSNCGQEFEYTKRGRLPKDPLCSNCSSLNRKEVKASVNKVPPPAPKEKNHKEPKNEQPAKKPPVRNLYEYYYDFVGPTEKEKPFEPGENLYAIPVLFYSERLVHTRGRIVEFIQYVDEKDDTCLVRAHFKRLGKKREEVVSTRTSRLRRFTRKKVLREDVDLDMLDTENEI